MNTKINGVILLITSLLTLSSCNDDFTNFEQQGAISDADVVSTEASALKLAVGLYDKLQYSYGRDWNSTFLVKLLPGDDANAGGGSSDDQPLLQVIDQYKTEASNPHVSSVWETMYEVISQSNDIIDKVGSSDLAIKDHLLAEAKFVRAWAYFELTTMFGDVPLRLSVVTSLDQYGIARSPQAEVYEVIKNDLTDAIAGLPDKTALDFNFRVSMGAAQALMGKVLVHQEMYSEALPFFEAVISNSAHDLEEKVDNVWKQAGDFGVESLFEIGYSSEGGYNWGGGRDVAWGGRNESNLHVQLMGPRGDGIFEVGPLNISNGWGFNLPTAKLVDAFDAMSDIDRKNATIATEAYIIAEGGSINPPTAGIWGYEGAIRLKYVTVSEDTDPDNTAELNYTTNFKIFRYAEVLLLAAEAYNKATPSNDSQALIELNKVRNRSGLVDLSGVSGDELFEAIVDEKFLELAHEGQRFWDLVRWGKADTELSNAGYTSTNDLFPIPVNEINLNPLISTADQNPGY